MNLNQVSVPAIDIQISIDFYKTLGLELIVESPHYARFLCEGGSTFSVSQTETMSEKMAKGIVVYFECKDLDKKVEELKKQGITFFTDPEDQRWLWREARLKDPFGNEICLFYGGENRINPPWRIES